MHLPEAGELRLVRVERRQQLRVARAHPHDVDRVALAGVGDGLERVEQDVPVREAEVANEQIGAPLRRPTLGEPEQPAGRASRRYRRASRRAPRRTSLRAARTRRSGRPRIPGPRPSAIHSSTGAWAKTASTSAVMSVNSSRPSIAASSVSRASTEPAYPRRAARASGSPARRRQRTTAEAVDREAQPACAVGEVEPPRRTRPRRRRAPAGRPRQRNRRVAPQERTTARTNVA